MKRAIRVGLILIAGAVALMASQEEARAYVSDCFCNFMNCLFGS